jgi:hypothetical protein
MNEQFNDDRWFSRKIPKSISKYDDIRKLQDIMSLINWLRATRFQLETAQELLEQAPDRHRNDALDARGVRLFP